jgi:hypothetical protein
VQHLYHGLYGNCKLFVVSRNVVYVRGYPDVQPALQTLHWHLHIIFVVQIFLENKTNEINLNNSNESGIFEIIMRVQQLREGH